eukprot:m.10672 g.10672  ORF g.10672 m.10672 type:complete len:477 (+) comp2543_c0_seq1:149-1579(+)
MAVLTLLASALLATCALPAQALFTPSPDRIAELRKYPRPAELTLETAKTLHADLLSRSRQIEQLHGHRHASYPRPIRTKSTIDPPTIFPTSYGADPTGKTDSTAAMLQAVAALLKGGANHSMASGILDLGGATLDLAGGQYLISSPIVIPMFYGNLLIARGTLRASASFPKDKYLIMVGNTTCWPPGGQGSCNEFVNVADVLFDAAHVAAGGFYIAHAMGATVGPAFFIGFNQAGVRIDGGHETMVVDTWLAEYYWSEPTPNASVSIGVQINGNDHYLDDVIVFEYAKVGVEVNGAANILSGVHTWNLGGNGIVVNSYQTRLIGCYLDYDRLVLVDPQQIAVENSFFLGTNTLLQSNRGIAQQFVMHFNTYTGGDSISLQGTFTTIAAISISDEINGNKFTTAKKVLNQTAATKWTFDFSDELLFPFIDHVVYSVATEAGFVNHVARKPVGTTVVIETSEPIDATVSVIATQALGI